MSLKDFVIIDKLGTGSFASVYKARRLIDQQIYALKKIDMKNIQQFSQKHTFAIFKTGNILANFSSFKNIVAIVIMNPNININPATKAKTDYFCIYSFDLGK